MRFRDRKDAGIKLAGKLEKFRDQDALVLALPRGGVVPAAEIAKVLGAPLDLIITKKIGHPLNDEYAICAISEDGDPVCNEAELSRVDPSWFENKVDRVRGEIKRRREKYLGKEKRRSLEDKTVIIVDDGIATGLTMMAAIKEAKARHPKRIVVAIPVVPEETAGRLEALVDELVAMDIDPNYLGAVGAYYDNFWQVEDSTVMAIMNEFSGERRNNP